jgi:hypothetical protein
MATCGAGLGKSIWEIRELAFWRFGGSSFHFRFKADGSGPGDQQSVIEVWGPLEMARDWDGDGDGCRNDVPGGRHAVTNSGPLILPCRMRIGIGIGTTPSWRVQGSSLQRHSDSDIEHG